MAKKLKRSLKERGGQSAFETAYDASATFGRIMSYFQLVGAIIVGIIFIIIGIVLIRKKSLSGQGTGKVTAISCNESNTATNTPCTATVQFVGADGKQYNSTINGVYTVGQEVPINYDPLQRSSKTTGIIILVVGILILLAGCVWFYFVQKYKAAAAISGVGDAANIVTTFPPYYNN